MPSPIRSTLADPALRDALVAMVRRRVPPPEVDEIVQATLTEALASRSCPDEPEAIRRWVHGIARHKVLDFHRQHARTRRREHEGSDVLDQVAGDGAPHDAADLLRWAERELPDRQGKTLDWLLREGSGEKLEEIANEAALPAPQVRQRVARLRKHYRARWAALVAAALGVAVVVAVLLFRDFRDSRDRAREREAKGPEITPDPITQGVELRRIALQRCDAGDWDPCLKGLDDAAKLDPAGDQSTAVKRAREAAEKAKAPPAPSTLAPPAPAPDPSDTKEGKTPPLEKPAKPPTTTTPSSTANAPAKPPGKPPGKTAPKAQSKTDTFFE